MVQLSLDGSFRTFRRATRMTIAMRSARDVVALAALLVVMMGSLARPGATQTPAQV
jgi:hypothetical protein